MATIKVNDASYFMSANKITTPSLIIRDGIYAGVSSTPGTGGANPQQIYLNAYIPLFRGNINSTVDYDRWRYTLGALKVGDYRAAVSRTFINHSPTVTVGASSNRISNGSNVIITAYASDPDGDNLSYKWNTGATSRSISVSASNTTKYYSCTVYDPHGGRATSNTVSVTWYNPNRAPYVTVTSFSPTPSFNGIVRISFRCSDPDNDRLYYQVKTGYNKDIVVDYGYISNTVNGQERTVTVGLQQSGDGYNCRVQVWDTSNATDYSDRWINKDTGWDAEYWVYDTHTQYETGSYHETLTYTYRHAQMIHWPAAMTGEFFMVARYAGSSYYDIGDQRAGEGWGTVYAVKRTGTTWETISTDILTKTQTQGYTGQGGGVYTDTWTRVNTQIQLSTYSVQAQKDVYYRYGHQTTGGFM